MRILPTAAAILALGAAAGACNWTRPKDLPGKKSDKELAAEQADRIRRTCGSEATYDRLKEVVFEEAARIRKGDSRNLDPIAAGAVVRMERPLVKSRDERLNVTVCTGHFILELPPGAENAFDGNRRAEADIQYSAQAAADESGLVYQMDGAEPIVYRLASFGLAGAAPAPVPQVAVPPPAAPPTAPQPVVAARAAPAARPLPPPAPPPPSRPPPPDRARPRMPLPPRIEAATGPAPRPAFNCRYARTRTERLVCSSPGLAASDRAMSSVYYGTIAAADPLARDRIRASRNGFLRRREQCGADEGCVARAYRQRIDEIRGMAGQ